MTHIQAGDATTGDAAGFAVSADADRLRRFAAAIGETTPLYVDEDAARSAWHAELRLPPITRATLAQFAEASGDLNPIHLDPDFARSVDFDDVFAQGMLSMAYLGRLLTSQVPQERLRQFRVRFTGRTLLGEAPICTGTALPVDDSLAQRITLRVTNQAGEERLAGEAVVSAPR